MEGKYAKMSKFWGFVLVSSCKIVIVHECKEMEDMTRGHWVCLIVVSEQCFTSPPTQYRLYGRRFLQVKRPNQQYQSTEGNATKYKENNENK